MEVVLRAAADMTSVNGVTTNTQYLTKHHRLTASGGWVHCPNSIWTGGWRSLPASDTTKLSESAAESRRHDSIATTSSPVPIGDYRPNRSSGGRFVGIDRRTERALHAARVTIRMNSSKGHHQRRRPPRRGVATVVWSHFSKQTSQLTGFVRYWLCVSVFLPSSHICRFPT